MAKRRPPKSAPTRSILVAARERLGKNQTDIADFFGITQAAVSHWETGESTPHPSQWQGIADAYGISFSKLCDVFGARGAA